LPMRDQQGRGGRLRSDPGGKNEHDEVPLGDAMTRSNAAYALAAFLLGATTVLVAKTNTVFDPNAFYAGADAKTAAAKLLAEGERLAADDTYQRIGVGRVAYMSGDKQKGEQIFESVMAGKHGKNDLYRIATAYAAAKKWDKAKPLFEKAIAMDAGDDSGIMKAACWFNVNGERARAEELFKMAFDHEPDHAWHYILAGGSYRGVDPF
jgi:tetratricopeptide (TPR) repeat protein